MCRAVFAVERGEPVFQFVFAVLVAHLVIAAVFLVERIAFLQIFQCVFSVLVLQIVGIHFVERGGERLLEAQLGAVEVGFGGFVFPFEGLPIEKRQVDLRRAAEKGNVKQGARFAR